MNNEPWIDKLKHRLEDHQAPLPSDGWERLSALMEVKEEPVVPLSPRRVTMFSPWTVGLAASLIGVVMLVGAWFWMEQSAVDSEAVMVKEGAVAVVKDAPAAVKEEAVVKEEAAVKEDMEMKDETMETIVTENPARSLQLADNQNDASDKGLPETTETAVSSAPVDSSAPAASSAPADSVTSASQPKYRPSSRDKYDLLAAATLESSHRSGRGSRRWGVGLYAGNSGGTGTFGNETAGMVQSSGLMNLPVYETNSDGTTLTDGAVLGFKASAPYLMQRTPQLTAAHHRLPLNFGVSFRYHLTPRFSLESGLTYTCLSSDLTYEGSIEVEQKLHYVGIPLRANYDLLQTDRFSIYASAGGTVEKCVYGKLGSERHTVDPLQLSVMGAVGAQYHLSKHVGIYVEPGISYFFDDGSNTATIRKEKPFNFSLQGGIRLSY